jgi:hypothetical protein
VLRIIWGTIIFITFQRRLVALDETITTALASKGGEPSIQAIPDATPNFADSLT